MYVGVSSRTEETFQEADSLKSPEGNNGESEFGLEDWRPVQIQERSDIITEVVELDASHQQHETSL